MKLIPKSVNALAVLPNRKYFRPASAEREAGEFEADEDHE